MESSIYKQFGNKVYSRYGPGRDESEKWKFNLDLKQHRLKKERIKSAGQSPRMRRMCAWRRKSQKDEISCCCF